MKKIFLIIFFTLCFSNANSETTLADLTCDGTFSCYGCKPTVDEAPFTGQFRLIDMGEGWLNKTVMINGIPGFQVFIENDDPSTGNILEFGEIKAGKKFGQINRVTGEIFLADVETWKDGKGGKFNMTYSGKCKKSEKLF